MWSLFLIKKNQKTKSMRLFFTGSQEFFYNIFDLIIQITSASKQLCSGAGYRLPALILPGANRMVNRILIITSIPADAVTLSDILDRARDGPFEIELQTQLCTALHYLTLNKTDAILVDLNLSDSQGITTFDRLYSAVPHIPILTLSAEEAEAVSIEAVQKGAQGYLTKGHFGSYLVPQSLRNIIHRKAVEEANYLEKALAEITLNSISDAVIGTDLSGNVEYLNMAAERMTKWSRDEARGHPISTVMPIINGQTREPVQNPVNLVLQQDTVVVLAPDTVLIRADKTEVAIADSTSPIHDSTGKIAGAVIVFHDITAERAMKLKMVHLAQYDFLTNLPNRVLLNDRIEQSISLAKRQGTHLAILFLDLDNFKHINDSLGHAIGDKLLQSVATRLTSCVRASDTVSRQGGDEFVILVAEEQGAEFASLTADKILLALAESHALTSNPENELYITTSIGISVYPTDGQDAETLIKNADTAMYQAKKKGRNNFQFFKNEMNVKAVERQLIETNLRRALERQEFVLYYQVKINLATGAITGAEALLRWDHPKWGMVPPGRFVAIAEECGLIVPIGRWVLHEACTQIKRWQDQGLKLESIAVNISAVEFRRYDFVDGVAEVLKQTGLAADRLQLEITESVLMRDAESSTAILKELKAMGVQLAVDDFGTGYSSLSYLNQFPIDVLKIDQSFVKDIGSATDSGVIASAVIAMGSSLKQKVIAEGVEQQTQLDFLQEKQCEEGQGYFFGHPLPADAFASMLANGLAQ